MTRKVRLTWLVILVVGSLAVQVSAGEPPVLKTPYEKSSYGLGFDIVKNLKNQDVEVDADLTIKGLQDSLSGEKLLFTEEDLRKALAAFHVRLG